MIKISDMFILIAVMVSFAISAKRRAISVSDFGIYLRAKKCADSRDILVPYGALTSAQMAQWPFPAPQIDHLSYGIFRRVTSSDVSKVIETR